MSSTQATTKQISATGRPALLPTSARNETFANITYHLDGELVPVLTVEIHPDEPVYFEHNIMLWKSPTVNIGMKAMKGAFKHMMAGMQVFMTQAEGQGMVAFSRDGAGHIVPLHMERGMEIDVREHQFLAASRHVEYNFSRVKGISSMMFGGTGFFIDKFRCMEGEGILWLHGYGNVFEKTLAAGEQIEVEPGGWLYKDASVEMDTNIQRIASGLFGGMNFITNRFTGPGRIGIQSMYMHFPTAE